MMSQRSKREMIEAVTSTVFKASKAGKEQILDEFVATTGYHRKYAIRVLKNGPKPKGLKKPGRRKKYQGAKWYKFWNKFGKSMVEFVQNGCIPFLSEGIAVLERCHELSLSPELKANVIEYEPGYDRSLLTKSPVYPSSTRSLDYQTRILAQKSHHSHLYSLER